MTTRPHLSARISTNTIDPDWFTDPYRARGYWYDDKPWAVVEIGPLELVAVEGDGLAGMRRLADALNRAIAQAEQARQDAALVEFDNTDVAVAS